MWQQCPNFVEIGDRLVHRHASKKIGYRRPMTMPEQPSQRRPGLVAGFAAAVAFFTRVPMATPSDSGWRLADSAWAFPLVGAGIGVTAAFAYLIAQLLGLGDWPAALLAVLAGIALTGALHEDGLADTADGLAGGRDPARKLDIMRDSRLGTFGVLALVLSIGLRAAALAELREAIYAGLALVAAHAASRALLAGAMWALPPARNDGQGFAAGRPRLAPVVVALLIAIVINLAALGPVRGVVALGLAVAAVCALAALARRQIGGQTGDVLGAVQQVAEVVILLAASAR
jgi:adenosylcobinamide-GDP ribazoletransferase